MYAGLNYFLFWLALTFTPIFTLILNSWNLFLFQVIGKLCTIWGDENDVFFNYKVCFFWETCMVATSSLINTLGNWEEEHGYWNPLDEEYIRILAGKEYWAAENEKEKLDQEIAKLK